MGIRLSFISDMTQDDKDCSVSTDIALCRYTAKDNAGTLYLKDEMRLKQTREIHRFMLKRF